VAEFWDFVLLNGSDSVFGCDGIENFAGFAEGVGDGAIEIKNERPVFHDDKLLEFSPGGEIEIRVSDWDRYRR